MNTRLVVDSSAICALFFEDETTPESEPLLERLEEGGVWVPALFLWEVGNVLLMAERRQRISMFCGPSETEELAGQLVADLLEADGYEVTFAGGGVANDEIREELTQREPDILLLFASSAKDAPFIRELIDGVRENGGYPDLQIVVGGGIFNRAPGLAEEIGADLHAASPRDLLEKLVDERGSRNERFTATTSRQRRVA